MVHHYNCQAFIILVLFTVPFYHFQFSRYLDLTECHFLSDIWVPCPDSSDLNSREQEHRQFSICFRMEKGNMFIKFKVTINCYSQYFYFPILNQYQFWLIFAQIYDQPQTNDTYQNSFSCKCSGTNLQRYWNFVPTHLK